MGAGVRFVDNRPKEIGWTGIAIVSIRELDSGCPPMGGPVSMIEVMIDDRQWYVESPTATDRDLGVPGGLERV